MSTGDDKKVYLWEYGIPVVIKHVQEPDMHAIPAAALHPSGKSWVGQSMDNQILVYEIRHGDFIKNKKKTFKGHMSAGYACGLKFSPDG